MKHAELTPKMAKYCILIGIGHRQGDSYQQAYGCLNRNSAKTLSTRLQKDWRIQARIKIERDKVMRELDIKGDELIHGLTGKQNEVSDIQALQHEAMASNRKMMEKALKVTRSNATYDVDLPGDGLPQVLAPGRTYKGHINRPPQQRTAKGWNVYND